MHTTTLGELGTKLPIGTPNGKELSKDFVLRPYKGRVDRHLGLWLEANADRYEPGQLLACQVGKLLSLLVSSAGGKDMPALDEDGNSAAAGELEVHKWYFADVMYLYLYARVASLGKEMEYPVSCPSSKCDFKTDAARFDLTTVDIRVADSTADLTVWAPLKAPYELRDGTKLNQVKLEPVRWSTMTRPGVLGGSISQIAMASLQDSICAINGNDKEYRLTPAELDNMERVDRVRINRIANKIAAGVDLETALDCPKCGTKITNALNWTFDYFFDASLPLET